MKKKFLSLALVLAMALTLLPTAAFAAVTHGESCPKGDDSSLAWKEDGGMHKQYCTACNVVDNDSGHNPSWSPDYAQTDDKTQHYQTCSVNGCTVTSAPENCAENETTPAYDAGSSSNGWKHTLKCDTCKKPFGTAEACAAAADATYTAGEGAAAGVTHTFTCEKCSANVTESCDFGTGTTCTKCKATKPAETQKSITVGNTTFDATNGLKASVAFTATNVTGTFTVKMTPQGGGAAKSGTGSASPVVVTLDAVTAKTTYDIEIAVDSDSGVKGTGTATYTPSPDGGDNGTPITPPKPEPPKEDNTPPSNNSQGIPVASEVSTPTQANQAINTLKNTNASTLQERLMTNDTAASSFASLEDAVKRAKGISVSVDVTASSAPSAVRSGVNVTGAAFNASGSSVRLVVNAPSKSYSASTGYQISMTLTGVSNPAKLAVPVIITLPLPSDVRADRVVVLHYHDGSSTPTRIVPAVSGSSLRFTVTGFSDFVVTDQESAGNNGVSQAFTTVQGGNRNDGTLDDATLASIAAMLSGDGVFVDVPSTHWAAKEIRWARDGGLMSGYGNGNFGPTASTTRQQLWMVLARLSGTRPADMAMARQWAINTGVSDGSNPTGVLSRQQLVTMLYRFAKSQGKDVSASAKLSGYTDSAKVASYAKEALSWAAAKGIMSGSNGKLNPEGTATRAHFAVFLYRYSNG